MNKYEAMFIIKPDLSEEEKKTIFNQINEAVTKHNGSVLSANIWSEKRKLFSPLKKCREGLYYLMNFTIKPLLLEDIKHTYKLSENILRVLITRIEPQRR